MGRGLAMMAMVLGWAACDGGAGGEATWHGQVRAISEQHCVECHDAGGIGPFDFTDEAAWADGAPTWAPAFAASVAAGQMPPWQASQDCHPLANERVLPDAAKQAVAAWAEAGFPEGNPADHQAPRTSEATKDAFADLGEPDLVLRPPERYTPDPASPDDYRCFVVDDGVDTETFVQGLRFAPDAVAMVHHAILYRLDGQYADLVADLEEEDAAPGYTCFGSPGTWDTDTLAAWAPGQIPERYPEGVARPIAKDSLLILQVHYNLLNVDPQAVPDDATGIELWTLPDGDEPTFSLRSIPFPNQSIRIPAGEPNHVERDLISLSRIGIPPGFTLEALGVMPHMHQLGTRIRLNRMEEDGTRTCLFEIPDWDFNWQQTYTFPEDQLLGATSADTLELVCEYDNSAANQPIVNGVRQEPRDVRWGDGTFDEMCLIYVNALIPRAFE